MSDVSKIIFEVLPIELYFVASLLMAIGVLPKVFHLMITEKEYKVVAIIMAILSFTQFITSIAALLFLYCFINGCYLDEEPFRGTVRLMLAINIFCSSASFFMLYNMDSVKGWFNRRHKK